MLPLVQPYVFFGGRCTEAIAFYQSAMNAQVEMVMHFSESPEPVPEGLLAPGFENKIMHASIKIGDCRIMLSDGCNEGEGVHGFSLALSVGTVEEADRFFSALSAGGEVRMPLTKTFWSPRYGMLTDRFGIEWMVMVPGEMP